MRRLTIWDNKKTFKRTKSNTSQNECFNCNAYYQFLKYENVKCPNIETSQLVFVPSFMTCPTKLVSNADLQNCQFQFEIFALSFTIFVAPIHSFCMDLIRLYFRSEVLQYDYIHSHQVVNSSSIFIKFLLFERYSTRPDKVGAHYLNSCQIQSLF